MKLDLDLSGPNGKMWDLTMRYYRLPEPYAWEVGSAALSLSSYIENIVGGAAADDKAYIVTFKVVTEGSEPKGAEQAVTADRLLYSQAIAIQDAGIKLLERLQQSAHMEIASGQRE